MKLKAVKDIQNHKLQYDSLTRVCPPEYWNLRERLGTFTINYIQYAINTAVAHDKDITNLLVTMASECIRSQILSQELQLGREFIGGYRQLMQVLNVNYTLRVEFSVQLEMSMSIQKQLNQFISVMEHVDNQKCLYLITESCVHHLTFQCHENNVVCLNDYKYRLEMIDNSIKAIQSHYFWKCKIINSLSL